MRTGRGAGLRAVAPLLLVALAVAVAFVAIAAGPGRPASLDERTRAVGATLRCPVCANLSVAEAPSGLAGDMRARIRAELAAGHSPDQVRAGFVAVYGESILLDPPRHGPEGLIWLVPVVALVGGGAAGLRWLRRGRTPAAVPPC